jgi:ubiquinol-cytochrome c reductase cytochrome b subunit
MSTIERGIGGVGSWLDERLRGAGFLKRTFNKVFPDHWSFMLGEIALYSFIVLLLSGTFLTLFFKPSMTEVVYEGSYVPLRGVHMSEAYASTLDLSFDVRGGLLMRQIHHWAALLFVAAMVVHSMRAFFTGAFRKPRELNWLLGVGLLTLGFGAGFTGYSLPDDLLSGTGLRIIEGILLSIPLVGTYLSFFLFGGEFPGDDLIPRLYIIHVLLIPGIIIALITLHIFLVVVQKHSQWPGLGRTQHNVVGYKFFPIYMSKAGGFFFVVFGVLAVLGGIAQINPVWLFGPYNPTQITAGSQPDWYIGFFDGALRAMPNWETNVLGHTISWNVLVPAVVIPGILFTLYAIYPFLEQWVTGDKREHHILDRPRDNPTRTGFGVMALTFYSLLLVNGGNDIIADQFGLSINAITWTVRIGVIVLPPIAFLITRRICVGLQRRDRDKLLHGRESGIVRRLPSGEMIEVHEPISESERHFLLARENTRPLELGPPVDENGVARPGRLAAKVRARVSRFFFGSHVDKPTPEEIEAARHHDAELESGEDAQAVDHAERRELTGSAD